MSKTERTEKDCSVGAVRRSDRAICRRQGYGGQAGSTLHLRSLCLTSVQYALAGLDQHPERPAKVIGMNQGLELLYARLCPCLKPRWIGLGLLQYFCQKLFLALDAVGLQAGFPAYFFQRGKIDVGGDVLFANVFEQAAARMMLRISPQCSMAPLR